MPGENLTREEAQERARTVQTKSYEIELDLTAGEELFRSDTTIHFDAVAGSSTFVDLIAKTVHHVMLNGVELDPNDVYSDARIHLAGLQEHNTVRIVADMFYMNTGEGLHRFVDPADGEVYLYSQFEVPDSRRMFAVFEQPDLKATFQFTVTAPARWKVVSVQPTPQPEPAGTAGEIGGEPVAVWRFSPTPIMSSYITAIIAGPYHEVRSSLTNADGRDIPLGVFCRASLADYLDAEYIFDITRKGFDFFARQFGIAYPFEKYDQLFVPEFNMGAMEHIGAVTFTEAYVFRSNVTDAMRERRVVTILHELAHMWFGNLVTMRWWNDLWLNESFAEYMSTLATAEATEWTDCWSTFVASEKTWAYRQDQLPSTHPIVAHINDLEDVLVNFDGITYAKGASVLKQLVAWVGREPFMKGVHNYFVKHAYGNTELPDLMRELEATSGRDLKPWTQLWLETTGVNTLRPVFDVDEHNRFTRFAIEQTADDEAVTLRPHRVAIGLYRDMNGELIRDERVELDVDGALTEVPKLIGVERPDLVLVNDDDLTYAKIRFDEQSLQTALSRLRDTPNSLARGLIWGAIWDATRDGELAASQFIDVVLDHVDIETNSTMMRALLNQLTTAAVSYVARERREATLQRVAEALWDLASNAAPGSDAQFQFVRSFATMTASETNVQRIARLLSGESTLEGLNIDTDLTWELTIALAANGHASEDDIAALLDSDRTASGEQSAAHARAAIPTREAKEEAWSTMVERAGASNLMIRHAGLGFSRAHDLSLLEPFVERFFGIVETVWRERSYAIAEEIFEGFFPARLANEHLRDATKAWLDEHRDAPQALRRFMIEHLADVERALHAQAVDRDHHG